MHDLAHGPCRPFPLLAAFFGEMFYVFYWSHRDCFNSEGRSFVPEEVVVCHDSSATLAVPTLIFLIIGVAILLTIFVKPRSRKTKT